MIAEEALRISRNGQKALILTYTENNQKELLNKICKINGYMPSNIIIKGWFTFLLEDIIRPYQSCIFERRIQAIYFNSTNPHKRGNFTIPNRSEKTGGSYNPLHYLTDNEERAHTTFLSKLATKTCNESKGKPQKRLSEVYNSILIDEIQDLVGWDFEIIGRIANIEEIALTCVGDFRQTIYTTHSGTKQPRTNKEKLAVLENTGFETEHMNISWRCVQSICDFADSIHAEEAVYPATESQIAEVPEQKADHQGVFVIPSDAIPSYLLDYNPTILRLNRATCVDECKGYQTMNFGEAKGLGFERVLILTTNKQRKFLKGNHDVFDKDKTEKAKNTFYVAVTRAKYSVALASDDGSVYENVKPWVTV
jgi:DNA helicase-2/ATP-dependent DNA helicase PcrA